MDRKFLKYLIDFDAMIYYHLFSLMSSDDLEYYLDKFEYSISNGEESWFEEFHKSMLQTDFFDLNGKTEGHLDMIFWNYIHESKKDLHKLIIHFFEDELKKNKNMKKFCSFSHIGQYRDIVKTIKDRTQYVGKDENGNPIFDESIKLATISFTGTCKLHGTNSGISFNQDGEFWCQSKENIITIQNDNAGFCFYVESRKEIFNELIKQIPFNGYDYVTIFGEFTGKSIQKGVAVSQLPKMFTIFDIKRSYDDVEKGNNVYATEDEIKSIKSPENGIYNIYDYPTYEITIDFNNPGDYLNRLTELTLNIDEKCPVGESFGVIDKGEGIVWTYINEDGAKLRFKTKGESHKVVKTKKLITVDSEKLNSISEFVEYSVTENRLEQATISIFGIGGRLDVKKTGDFLKWLVNDILREEVDTLIENGLEPKEVTSAISIKGKSWLFERINKF